MSVTVAMLICTQWRIYLQWYVADIHVGVATLQANDADCRPQYTQRALSRQIDSRSSECKNLILKNFLAGIITLKQCSRVTPFTTVMTGPYLGQLHSIAAYSQWEEEANAGLHSLKAMNSRCTGLSVKRQSQQSHDASLSANEGERSVEDEVARKLSGF